MRTVKFVSLWLLLSVVMCISWALGFGIGQAITGSGSPPATGVDPGTTMAILGGVCMVNALLLAFLFWNTSRYRGWIKWITLILFVFGVQFFLTQMETWFFAQSVGIGLGQIAGILIAGAFVALATAAAGIPLSEKFHRVETAVVFRLDRRPWKKRLPGIVMLIFAGYPLLYIAFGYFVAWQSEALRIYYSGSGEFRSFFHQLAEFFASGLYFFQLLRALLWLAITLPVVQMLHGGKLKRCLLMGLLTSLLPSTLLFIPNPYMPAVVAHMHFIEISFSNFLWGMWMAYVLVAREAQARTA